MKIISGRKFFFLSFFLIVVLYLFWGPLFPWNPMKFGFKKIESSKATVYINEFNDEGVVYKLDEILKEEEEFHGMRLCQKITVWDGCILETRNITFIDTSKYFIKQ
jgi:hypothetical protein